MSDEPEAAVWHYYWQRLEFQNKGIITSTNGKKLNEGVESTVELFVGREVLRAGLTSLRASFTVSPRLVFFVFGFLCLFVLLLFEALGIPLF